jgi:hypothetical protein
VLSKQKRPVFFKIGLEKSLCAELAAGLAAQSHKREQAGAQEPHCAGYGHCTTPGADGDCAEIERSMGWVIPEAHEGKAVADDVKLAPNIEIIAQVGYEIKTPR